MSTQAPSILGEPFFAESIVKSNSLYQNKCVPSYFSKLDEVIKGFLNSNLIIIGGRPCMGCRTLALTMACRQAWENHKVACFFMSFSEHSLTDRVRRIYNAYEKPSTAPHPFFYIDYKLDTVKLRNEVERLKREENIEAVYVESVQMIGVKEQTDMLLQAGSAAKALWEISREFDIPVIALSTLSRAPEHRCYFPLRLSDLRESSAIEMYADVVLLVARPEYYGLLIDENGNSLIGVAKLEVAKNVNGKTTNVELMFDKSSVVFKDLIRPVFWSNIAAQKES